MGCCGIKLGGAALRAGYCRDAHAEILAVWRNQPPELEGAVVAAGQGPLGGWSLALEPGQDRGEGQQRGGENEDQQPQGGEAEAHQAGPGGYHLPKDARSRRGCRFQWVGSPYLVGLRRNLAGDVPQGDGKTWAQSSFMETGIQPFAGARSRALSSLPKWLSRS